MVGTRRHLDSRRRSAAAGGWRGAILNHSTVFGVPSPPLRNSRTNAPTAVDLRQAKNEDKQGHEHAGLTNVRQLQSTGDWLGSDDGTCRWFQFCSQLLASNSLQHSETRQVRAVVSMRKRAYWSVLCCRSLRPGAREREHAAHSPRVLTPKPCLSGGRVNCADEGPCRRCHALLPLRALAATGV